MEGTCYEGKGQFYHDALTLMTCNKIKQYMEHMTCLRIGFSLLRDFSQGQDIAIPFLAIALS
jgi:hypothetical protein